MRQNTTGHHRGAPRSEAPVPGGPVPSLLKAWIQTRSEWVKQSLVRKLPCLWDQNKIVEGSLGGTGHFLPQERPERVAVCWRTPPSFSLSLHFLAAFSLISSPTFLGYLNPLFCIMCIGYTYKLYFQKEEKGKNMAL